MMSAVVGPLGLSSSLVSFPAAGEQTGTRSGRREVNSHVVLFDLLLDGKHNVNKEGKNSH